MRVRQILGYCLASLIALTQTLSGVAVGQQIEDSEDPVIIHRQADSPGIAGELQTFLARVYDDVEVVEVTLYYRQSETANFQSIPMRPLLDSLGEYMIAVETSLSEYPGLQYYIEALDASGNVTNRGFSYAPIVLPLKPPEAPPAETISEPVIAERSSSGFSSSSILMGAAAVLLLGALAGGGGGGDGGGDNNGGTNGITLTIISDAPGGN
ncbi:MAG: hypothetical protein AAF404_01750 [Pseudomonadota bacterium]